MTAKLLIVAILLGMASLVTGSQGSDDMAKLKLENAKLKQKVAQLEKKIKALEVSLRKAKGVKGDDLPGKPMAQLVKSIPKKYRNTGNILASRARDAWVKENLVGQRTHSRLRVSQIGVKTTSDGKVSVIVYANKDIYIDREKIVLSGNITLSPNQAEQAINLRLNQQVTVTGVIERVYVVFARNQEVINIVLKDATYTRKRQ